MKQYRIGDFARHLGVTTDFLKHYENAGLIDVCQHENGYRYYPFDQAARIIEYRRLRNYGVTLREMEELLSDRAEEVFALLDGKVEEMEAAARRLSGIAEEHRRLRAWYERRRERPVDWEIRTVGPVLFLPHSDSQEFRNDPGIRDILNAWIDLIPVVKSALTVDLSEAPSDSAPRPVRWGFAVTEHLLEHHALPVNGTVECIPAGKAFIFHFSELPGAFSMQAVADGTHPAFRLMARLGFRARGTGILVNEMRVANDTGSTAVGMGRFILPLAGD